MVLPFPDGVLRNLLDVLPTGVNVLRPVHGPGGELVDFAVAYLNPAAQRLTGLPAHPGGPLLACFPAAVGAGVFGYCRRVYLDNATDEYEVDYQANGLAGPFRLAARRSGEWLVVSVTDLRERQAREQALPAEAEPQRGELRRLIEQAPVAVAVYRGPQHRVALANAATLAIWGRTWAEVAQRPVFDVLPEAAVPEVVAHFDRVYATGTAHSVYEQPTTLQRHGRPEVVYWNFVFQPELLPDGSVVGIRSVGTDVTAQVRARQREQESEARFRVMADAAPNLVWAVHPDSSIQYVNRAFLDFVGLEHEQQYMTTGWGPYIHPDELALTQNTLVEAIAQRQPYVLEHRMRRHDGQYRWLLAQGAPSYLPGGELYRYVGSAIDITEFKQANEQLRRTNLDLDNFIYTASHDLKAPIANIEGLLDAVEHELPPAGRVGMVPVMLGHMHTAVERFKRTIAHLTDLSRLQQEHNQPASEVSLARVVHEVQLDLAPLMTQAEGQIEIRIPADATLRFSEKNLRSIVYNLLSNALKYRHPARPPRVAIAYALSSAEHRLEVRDNGLGLDLAQHQGKLFGMFKRLHTHVEGTGVGLHMVKRIVENAGGRIEVESQLGQGSTFRVCLPR